MNDTLFFEYIHSISNVKILNKFFKIIPKKHTNLSLSSYKFYVSLIKKYRCLGILSFKTIKYIKIKEKNRKHGYFKEKNL